MLLSQRGNSPETSNSSLVRRKIIFNRKRRIAVLLILPAVLTLPLMIVHSAGGGIEGKITDTKGAAVVAATVTVTDEVTNRNFNGITDQPSRTQLGQ